MVGFRSGWRDLSTWTYPVTDLSGTVLHDNAPILCDYFTDSLGVAQGSLSAKFPLGAGVDVDDLLLPWRRVFWPCRDGRPFGAFVVTALNAYDQRSTAVDFIAQRIDAVFTRREIESTLVFRQVDQFDIARCLMGYALGLTPLAAVDAFYRAMINPLPGANVPAIRLDTGLSGVLRDREDNDDGYQLARHPKVSDMLTNLTNLENGFDYRLDYDRDGTTGVPFVTVRLGYPQIGRTASVLPLEYPGNVTTWSYAVDTAQTATSWRVYGAGQGVIKMIGFATVDYGALQNGWPLLMGSESSTASDQVTLDAAGRSGLIARRGANEGWAIELDSGTLGTYDLGDQASLHIRNQRWPNGRRLAVRITGHRIEPSRPGRVERIIPTVVEV